MDVPLFVRRLAIVLLVLVGVSCSEWLYHWYMLTGTVSLRDGSTTRLWGHRTRSDRETNDRDRAVRGIRELNDLLRRTKTKEFGLPPPPTTTALDEG